MIFILLHNYIIIIEEIYIEITDELTWTEKRQGDIYDQSLNKKTWEKYQAKKKRRNMSLYRR